VINPDGSISKLSILRDITERKRMEESLRDSEGRSHILKTEQTDRREHKRYRPGNKYRVSFENTNTVRIKDISFGGVCLVSQKEMDINSIHEIKISPPMNGEIKTKSLVVWSFRQEMPNYEAGLKFIEFSNASKRSLEKIINNLAAKL